VRTFLDDHTIMFSDSLYFVSKETETTIGIVDQFMMIVHDDAVLDDSTAGENV